MNMKRFKLELKNLLKKGVFKELSSYDNFKLLTRESAMFIDIDTNLGANLPITKSTFSFETITNTITILYGFWWCLIFL